MTFQIHAVMQDSSNLHTFFRDPEKQKMTRFPNTAG